MGPEGREGHRDLPNHDCAEHQYVLGGHQVESGEAGVKLRAEMICFYKLYIYVEMACCIFKQKYIYIMSCRIVNGFFGDDDERILTLGLFHGLVTEDHLDSCCVRYSR